jgi:hypothetical protein
MAVIVPLFFFLIPLLLYLEDVTLLVADISLGAYVQAVVTEEGFEASCILKKLF